MSDQQTPRADNEFMPKARALFNMTLCGCITPRQQHEGDIVNLFEVTDRPALVRPGLFIGSWDSESDQELLQQLGITHVLQVGSELCPSFPESFNYQNVPIDDVEDEDIVVHLQRPLEYIGAGRQKGGVLVHCAAGISRSASFVIAYLMYSEKLAFKEAAAAVKEVRPVICPNPGFVLQLKEWEKLEHEFSMWQPWSQQRCEATRTKVSPLMKLPSHLKRARIPSIFSLFDTANSANGSEAGSSKQVEGSGGSVTKSGFSITRILSWSSKANSEQQLQQQPHHPQQHGEQQVERSRLSVSKSANSASHPSKLHMLRQGSPMTPMVELEAAVRSALSISRSNSGGQVARSAGSLSKSVAKSDTSKTRMQLFLESGPAERRALLQTAGEVDAV